MTARFRGSWERTNIITRRDNNNSIVTRSQIFLILLYLEENFEYLFVRYQAPTERIFDRKANLEQAN